MAVASDDPVFVSVESTAYRSACMMLVTVPVFPWCRTLNPFMFSEAGATNIAHTLFAAESKVIPDAVLAVSMPHASSALTELVAHPGNIYAITCAISANVSIPPTVPRTASIRDTFCTVGVQAGSRISVRDL